MEQWPAQAVRPGLTGPHPAVFITRRKHTRLFLFSWLFFRCRAEVSSLKSITRAERLSWKTHFFLQRKQWPSSRGLPTGLYPANVQKKRNAVSSWRHTENCLLGRKFWLVVFFFPQWKILALAHSFFSIPCVFWTQMQACRGKCLWMNRKFQWEG